MTGSPDDLCICGHIRANHEPDDRRDTEIAYCACLRFAAGA